MHGRNTIIGNGNVRQQNSIIKHLKFRLIWTECAIHEAHERPTRMPGRRFEIDKELRRLRKERKELEEVLEK